MYPLYIADILLILLFALALCAAFRFPSIPALLAGGLIFAYADIIFSAEVLATLGLLEPWAFVFFHSLTASIAAAVWWHFGRPALPQLARLKNPGLLVAANSAPDLALLVVGVAVAYLIGAALIIVVPPNNYDGMTYHLSRVGYWLQHNSFYPWPTHNTRQTTYPLNAEIGILWTVVFTRGDYLAGYVQWLAALLAATAIFGLARFLGYSRAQSAFATAVWATLPEVLLQSTTVQNDLVVSAFFVAMIYFFFLGFRFQDRGAFVMSGAALGLAFGTKVTAFFALPGFLAGTSLLFFAHGRTGLRHLVSWLGAGAAGFLLLGAYAYSTNVLAYGSPLALHTLSPPPVLRSPANVWETSPKVTVNTLRFLYEAADSSGLPRAVRRRFQNFKANAMSAVFRTLQIDPNLPGTLRPGVTFDLIRVPLLHEDFAWFGLVGFCILLPAVFFQLLVALSKGDMYRLTLVIAGLFFVPIVGLLLWGPWTGRYFVLVATLWAPLIAPLFRAGPRFVFLRWVIVLLALFIAGYTTVWNQAKPLAGPKAVWKLDRVGRSTLNQPGIEPLVRSIEDAFPPNARVAIILDHNDWDRPIFGEHFTRAVIPVHPPSKAGDLDWFTKREITHLLVRATPNGRLPRLPAEVQEIGSFSYWHLFTVGDANLPPD